MALPPPAAANFEEVCAVIYACKPRKHLKKGTISEKKLKNMIFWRVGEELFQNKIYTPVHQIDQFKMK